MIGFINGMAPNGRLRTNEHTEMQVNDHENLISARIKDHKKKYFLDMRLFIYSIGPCRAWKSVLPESFWNY